MATVHKRLANAEAAVQPAFQRAIQKKRFREHGEGFFGGAFHWELGDFKRKMAKPWDPKQQTWGCYLRKTES